MSRHETRASEDAIRALLAGGAEEVWLPASDVGLLLRAVDDLRAALDGANRMSDVRDRRQDSTIRALRRVAVELRQAVDDGLLGPHGAREARATEALRDAEPHLVAE